MNRTFNGSGGESGPDVSKQESLESRHPFDSSTSWFLTTDIPAATEQKAGHGGSTAITEVSDVCDDDENDFLRPEHAVVLGSTDNALTPSRIKRYCTHYEPEQQMKFWLHIPFTKNDHERPNVKFDITSLQSNQAKSESRTVSNGILLPPGLIVSVFAKGENTTPMGKVEAEFDDHDVDQNLRCIEALGLTSYRILPATKGVLVFGTTTQTGASLVERACDCNPNDIERFDDNCTAGQPHRWTAVFPSEFIDAKGRHRKQDSIIWSRDLGAETPTSTDPNAPLPEKPGILATLLGAPRKWAEGPMLGLPGDVLRPILQTKLEVPKDATPGDFTVTVPDESGRRYIISTSLAEQWADYTRK